MAGLGCACLTLLEYEKKYFPVEAVTVGSNKLDQDRTLVSLSGLHNNESGQDNCQLVETVCGIKPDAVLCNSDTMVCKGTRDVGVPIKLISQLADRYPVYYGDGNHENRTTWERNVYGILYEEYKSTLRRMEMVYLEDETAALETDVLISGIDLGKRHYREALYQKMPSMGKEHLDRGLGRADHVEGKDRFRILLARSPLYFADYAAWGANLTLTDHFHGGIVQIPTLGGVMTPQYQFFLPWCAGDFEQQGKRMIVGRGLGTHSINIRLSNRPRLVVVYPKKQWK